MSKPDLSLNHYQRLGVSVNATDADIERAFKKLLPKFHPDKHPGDLDAAANMALINNARDVLLDSAQRKVYDYENKLGIYANSKSTSSSTMSFDTSTFNNSYNSYEKPKTEAKYNYDYDRYSNFRSSFSGPGPYAPDGETGGDFTFDWGSTKRSAPKSSYSRSSFSGPGPYAPDGETGGDFTFDWGSTKRRAPKSSFFGQGFFKAPKPKHEEEVQSPRPAFRVG